MINEHAIDRLRRTTCPGSVNVIGTAIHAFTPKVNAMPDKHYSCFRDVVESVAWAALKSILHWVILRMQCGEDAPYLLTLTIALLNCIAENYLTMTGGY